MLANDLPKCHPPNYSLHGQAKLALKNTYFFNQPIDLSSFPKTPNTELWDWTALTYVHLKNLKDLKQISTLDAELITGKKFSKNWNFSNWELHLSFSTATVHI